MPSAVFNESKTRVKLGDDREGHDLWGQMVNGVHLLNEKRCRKLIVRREAEGKSPMSSFAQISTFIPSSKSSGSRSRNSSPTQISGEANFQERLGG